MVARNWLAPDKGYDCVLQVLVFACLNACVCIWLMCVSQSVDAHVLVVVVVVVVSFTVLRAP